MDERAFDLFLDKVGDLEVDTPQVRSDRGKISKDLLFGFDVKQARAWMNSHHDHDHDHDHAHSHNHTSEMECLSVTLTSSAPDASVDLSKLEGLLKSAPKDEVYRIKAILYSNSVPTTVVGTEAAGAGRAMSRYILNWSFGRWTWSSPDGRDRQNAPLLRMSLFTAPHESQKWQKRIEDGKFIASTDVAADSRLEVRRVQ